MAGGCLVVLGATTNRDRPIVGDYCAAGMHGVLTTGKPPLIDGNMVHGMEVNWPGIMVLIQYVDKRQ